MWIDRHIMNVPNYMDALKSIGGLFEYGKVDPLDSQNITWTHNRLSDTQKAKNYK